ncbi:6032_t:CDS:1, partial [Cetraspora pellucida]
MEQRIFYDDCFISLGYEDEKESIVFIILKGAFYVYLGDRILQSRDIIFADKTWGYGRLLNPSIFSIFDAYSNDEYAKITFKNKEIDIQLNECSLSGWLTKN